MLAKKISVLARKNFVQSVGKLFPPFYLQMQLFPHDSAPHTSTHTYTQIICTTAGCSSAPFSWWQLSCRFANSAGHISQSQSSWSRVQFTHFLSLLYLSPVCLDKKMPHGAFVQHTDNFRFRRQRCCCRWICRSNCTLHTANLSVCVCVCVRRSEEDVILSFKVVCQTSRALNAKIVKDAEPNCRPPSRTHTSLTPRCTLFRLAAVASECFHLLLRHRGSSGVLSLAVDCWQVCWQHVSAEI